MLYSKLIRTHQTGSIQIGSKINRNQIKHQSQIGPYEDHTQTKLNRIKTESNRIESGRIHIRPDKTRSKIDEPKAKSNQNRINVCVFPADTCPSDGRRANAAHPSAAQGLPPSFPPSIVPTEATLAYRKTRAGCGVPTVRNHLPYPPPSQIVLPFPPPRKQSKAKQAKKSKQRKHVWSSSE